MTSDHPARRSPAAAAVLIAVILLFGAAAFVAGVPSEEWGQAVAAYVALAAGGATGDDHAGPAADVDGLRDSWHRELGFAAPKTVLTAPALKMLPNGKPDRLAMTAELSALHQGK